MAQLRRKAVSAGDRKVKNPIAKAMSRARHSSFYHDLSLRGKHPLRLLGTPKDIWQGSVTAGTQIVSGKMVANGHILENPHNEQNIWADGEVWLATDINDSWLEYLHSFNWLRDLNQAVDRRGAKKRAEELIETWIEHNTQWGEISWRTDIVGERITNWLIYAPLIMDTDDVIYRGRILDILARSARHLMKMSSDLPEGPAALKAIIGLTLSGLYIPFGDEWLKQGLGYLKYSLGKEILVDGGIRSRNPQELLHIFMNMVLLRDAFPGMGQKTPKEVIRAVSRMAGNLKSISHGDGKLPLFNGATIQNNEDIYACLIKAKEENVEIHDIEQSGYSRLERGNTIIIQDIGPPPEPQMSRKGHAGSLSFELSRGKERLIINSGNAAYVNSPEAQGMDALSRSTDAHSTLVLNGENSSELRDDGLIGRGITNIRSERYEENGHIMVEAEHDGYALTHEYNHRRLLYINEAGTDIRGEDKVEHIRASENGDILAIDVHFFLHPNVSLTEKDDRIELGLPSGETWEFYCRDARMSAQDGIYYGDAGKLSPCKQIILSGEASGSKTTILWSLKLKEN